MKSNDISELVRTLHPFEIMILNFITNEPFTLEHLIEHLELNESQARSGANWLLSRQCLQEKERSTIYKYEITEKGRSYAQSGLPELALFTLFREKQAITTADIMSLGNFDKKDLGSVYGALKKNNELIIAKDGTISPSPSFQLDFYQQFWQLLQKLEKTTQLAKNQLTAAETALLEKAQTIQLYKGFFKIRDTDIIVYQLSEEGKTIQSGILQNKLTGNEISQLTSEILKEKTWKNRGFREYNIHLPAPHIQIGKKHPYREFLDFLKYKFVGLGFQEMRGSIVQPEFWNMDALFMPQTHPARDIHDVYYINQPTHAKSVAEPYYTNVAQTHENGGKTGSKGWGYKFSEQKAKQLILRSQGTVLSARKLADAPSIPGKYFSIARCFRYDKVDATHLADFYQVEGIVLSNQVNFKTLLGLLNLFAREIARAKQVKFVPAYFPFTEPSVELHIKHPVLGWYELGGAGIFRPEVTTPLGIEVPVLAWGLGIDRMAMMALGFNDIRDLFSRDLDLIRNTRMGL